MPTSTPLSSSEVDPETTGATLDAYAKARVAGLRSALAILALLAVVALFLTQTIPSTPPVAADRR